MKPLLSVLTLFSTSAAVVTPVSVSLSNSYKWVPVDPTIYKEIKLSNWQSDQQFHPRGNGDQVANYGKTDTSHDVCMGLWGSGAHAGRGYEFHMTGLSEYVKIDATISATQLQNMVEQGKKYTLKDIEGKFSNKNDVLNCFTCRSHWYNQDKDKYLNAQNYSSEWYGNRMGSSSGPEHDFAMYRNDPGRIYYEGDFGEGLNHIHNELIADNGRNMSDYWLKRIMTSNIWDHCHKDVPIDADIFNNYGFSVNKTYWTDYDAALAGSQEVTWTFVFSLNPYAFDVSANYTVDSKTHTAKLDINVANNGQNPYTFYFFGQQHHGKVGIHGNWNGFQRFDAKKTEGPTFRWGDGTRGNWAGCNNLSWSYHKDFDFPNPLEE